MPQNKHSIYKCTEIYDIYINAKKYTIDNYCNKRHKPYSLTPICIQTTQSKPPNPHF